MVKHLALPRYTTVVLVSALAFHLLAAWLGTGFYRCDEHFQVIEFISLKMGRTVAATLPWEYSAAIRSWFQPWLYYCVEQALDFLRVSSPTQVVRVLRLLSALFAWSGLWALCRCLVHFIPNDGWVRRATIASLAFFYLVPSLAARTSGENLSQAFLAWALLSFIGALETNYPRRGYFVFAFSLAAGAAFLCRYQTAVVPLAMIAWLAVQKRDLGWRDLSIGVAGVAVILGLSTLIDRWGYGFWSAPYIQYFRWNILLGKAASFGVSPWWRYIEAMRWQILPPLGYLLILGVVLGVVFAWRHVVAWMVAAFVVSHCVIAHKELRFLFPMLQCMILLAGIGASIYAAPLVAWWRHRQARMQLLLRVALGGLIVSAVAVNIVALLTLSVRAELWYPMAAIERLTKLSPRGWLAYTVAGQQPLFSRCGLDLGFYRVATTRSEVLHLVDDNPVALDPAYPTFFVLYGEGDTLAHSLVPNNCTFLVESGPNALVPWSFLESRRYALYQCNGS
jgi:hypothetical protein